MEPASSSGLPVSAMVGTSGTAGERRLPVTARPRSWPPRITVAAADSDVTMIGVWPPTAELIAGPPPLNGTCTRSRPCLSLNSSPTIRTCVAAPDEANVYLPGFAFTTSTSCCTVCAGNDGCTDSTCGPDARSVIGAKSLTGS